MRQIVDHALYGQYVFIRRTGGQNGTGHHHVVQVEAGVHTLQVHGASQQEPGPDQDWKRQRNFGDDQRRAHPIADRPLALAAGLTQRALQVATRHLQRRHESREQRTECGGGDRERRDRPADVGLLETGYAGRGIGSQGADPKLGERQRQRAGKARQQQILGQQLPHDAPAACPDRRANRHLAGARVAACQLQVGHVAAGNEQDEQHRALEQKQGRAVLGRDEARPAPTTWAAIRRRLGYR